MRLVGDVNRDLIVESRRCAKAWCSIIRPERADECLLGRALRGRNNSVAAEIFRFVVSSGVFRAGHVRWRWRLKLGTRLDHECFACAPVRAKRERDLADRVLPPMTWKVAGKEINADVWFRYLGTVRHARSEDGGGDLFPDHDPSGFRWLRLNPQ